MSKRFTLGRFRRRGQGHDPVVCRICAKLGGGRETVIAVAMIELLERRTLLPVVHLGQVNGNGTTTVVVNNSLVVGNFSQAALLNNGMVEIDGAGAIGQLTGSGNLTIGNGTSNNTVQLAPGATPDGVNNTQTSLTVSPGSTLDITNNTLLLNYGLGSTPLAAAAELQCLWSRRCRRVRRIWRDRQQHCPGRRSGSVRRRLR